MNTSQHKIAVIVKYMPPTNTKSSRVKLSLPRWENKSLFIPFDYEDGDICNMAQSFLESFGAVPISYCDLGTHFALLFNWSDHEMLFKAFNLK